MTHNFQHYREIQRLMIQPAYWDGRHPNSTKIRAQVTNWFKEKYDDNIGSSDIADPAYFLSRINCGKTLFVGEGNLSFTFSLINIPNIIKSNIITTTYEDENDLCNLAKGNVELLRKFGITIQHGIDAKNIEKYYPYQKFETIIFQFPHTGSREPIRGSNPNFILVRNFLKSARSCLNPNGKILITAVNNPHYLGAFQFEEAATSAGFQKPEVFDFPLSSFVGYNHTNTNDTESALEKHTSFSTWVFTKPSEKRP